VNLLGGKADGEQSNRKSDKDWQAESHSTPHPQEFDDSILDQDATESKGAKWRIKDVL
jgi:hypothetical protein